MVTQSWMSLPFVFSGTAQGNPLVEGHVVADFTGFANDDAHPMIDEEGFPYIMQEIMVHGKPKLVKSRLTEQAKPMGAQPQPWPSGHSPLEQGNSITAFRVSQGFENGSASVPMGGQLADAVRFFQQQK